MEWNKHPPEFAPLPQELELHPERELAAPPPEYGQRTAPPAEETKPKRRLRQFLAVPAVLLVSFLCLHGVLPTPTPPTPSTPSDPSGPAPVETAAPLPDRPQGSVLIDVFYAVRYDDSARYSYTLFSPIPSLDATQEQIDAYKGTPYPVSVYARVSDEAGHMVAPANDPDVWDSSRSLFEYSVDTAGLEGALTLTLTAVYTEEGEERQSVAVVPLEELPPAPETYATLSFLSSGDIDYYAQFNPQPQDTHDYRLSVANFCFVWFDADGREVGKSEIWDYDTVPSLNGNSAVSDKAVAAAYEGPAWIVRPNDRAVAFCARLVLLDETTTYPYTIDSNIIEMPDGPTTLGRLEAYENGKVDATFFFAPAPGDTHEYDLHVVSMGQIVDTFGGFSLVSDPSAYSVYGDNENGYYVYYSGGSMVTSIPEGSRLRLVLTLEDRNGGAQYGIETNWVDRMEKVYPYPTYPLADGKLAIIVLNDTPTVMVPSPLATEDDYLTLLAVETMPESEFEQYYLPSAWTPDGYDFAGWVVHVNNPFDMGTESDIFTEYNGDPPTEALIAEDSFCFTVYGTLTKEDVQRVPPSADGVRYVYVHAVWIKQEVDEPLIYLDDGYGHVSVYGMETPLASEGFIYLCNYPVSAPESGMVFDGWYDSEGNRVDMLVSYFSFATALYNDDGAFVGYQWDGTYNPVYLTAHWE